MKKADRDRINAKAKRYVTRVMGLRDPLGDQEANWQWRHLYQFGRFLLASERRRAALEQKTEKE